MRGVRWGSLRQGLGGDEGNLEKQMCERVGPSKYVAFTSDSYTELTVNEHDVGEVSEHTEETHEDVVEASIPEASGDPTLFISYDTYVVALI